NFAASGVLALAAALAMWRLRAVVVGAWAPVLIAIYGVGLVAAGIFPPDAALSFPPGAPPGVPATQSLHSQLHGYAFDIAFLSLILACFVFAYRFAAQQRWAWAIYSVATAMVIPP